MLVETAVTSLLDQARKQGLRKRAKRVEAQPSNTRVPAALELTHSLHLEAGVGKSLAAGVALLRVATADAVEMAKTAVPPTAAMAVTADSVAVAATSVVSTTLAAGTAVAVVQAVASEKAHSDSPKALSSR